MTLVSERRRAVTRCALSTSRLRASYILTQPTLRVWALALGLLVFYFVLSPRSANFASLNLLTENALPLAWVAAGQMAVLIAAQIDLSVGCRYEPEHRDCSHADGFVGCRHRRGKPGDRR